MLEIMEVKEVLLAVHVALVLVKAVQVALEVGVLMAHYLLVEQLLQFLPLLEEEKQHKVMQVKVILTLAAAEVAVLLKLAAQMVIVMGVMVQLQKLMHLLLQEAAEAAAEVLKEVAPLAVLEAAVMVEIILMVTELQVQPILAEVAEVALVHLAVMMETELMVALA